MISLLIYHNPRCSKSRQALEILQQSGVDFEVVEYLKEAPSMETLVHLLDALGGDLELMTRSEDLKKAGLTPSLGLLAEHPEYLQRPILVKDGKVAVARSPEAVREFLNL